MLACWSLSRRLEQAAALVARSRDLAGAVDAATAALQDSVARAGFAARAIALECCVRPTIAERFTNRANAAGGLPSAGSDAVTSAAGAAEPSQAASSGTAASSGRTGELSDYWRAEADATRQLDSLRALSLEPGLEWLARPLAGLRDALLARMAAADDAMRHPGARKDAAASLRDQIPPRTPDDATARPADGAVRPDAGASLAGSADPPGDSVDVLAGRLRDAAEDHRREVVAVPLAQAALDRRRLVSAALVGAVLSSVLMLAARRRGSATRVRPCGSPAPILEPAPSCPDVAKTLPGATPDAPPAPQPVGTAPGLRILLVEDNTTVRFSMEMMLAELGHRVSAAADAAEAMRLAEANPDVLVTDLGLPDVDGLTLARRLRAQSPGLRVVIASGRPGSVPGAVWLQKPFGLDGLRQAVEASATPGA